MVQPTRRILLADADDGFRADMRALLQAQPGWQVVAEAADGHAALVLARETDPDVAILDYLLPTIDGLEVARALRREVPRAEILIHTWEIREEVVAELLRVGARGYVLKSDPPSDLVTAVVALLARRPFFSGAVSATLLDRFVERKRDAGRVPALTPRERDVVRLVSEGRSNREIADLLSISTKTIETHRAAAMQKLQVRTTADLVRYAVRHHLVDP